MQYKYETHCHTKLVSRCGQLDIKELVELYKDMKLDKKNKKNKKKGRS